MSLYLIIHHPKSKLPTTLPNTFECCRRHHDCSFSICHCSHNKKKKQEIITIYLPHLTKFLPNIFVFILQIQVMEKSYAIVPSKRHISWPIYLVHPFNSYMYLEKQWLPFQKSQKKITTLSFKIKWTKRQWVNLQ